MCDYWADGYDFARHARRTLQRFPQFRHEVDGLGIHFLHVPSPHADAMPLVLTHGWPGTFVEFLDVIEPLSPIRGDPADAFHVVVPSLPGYAYSDKPTAPGWGISAIARAWDTLMGDSATTATSRRAATGAHGHHDASASSAQEHVTGIHVNMPLVNFAECDMTDLTEREARTLARARRAPQWGMGYSAEQSTRPQTLGYGLTDSPAGQSAWILEKFWAWTDCDGHPEHALTRDHMLDNISLYWFTARGGIVGAPLLGEASGAWSRSPARRGHRRSRRRSACRSGGPARGSPTCAGSTPPTRVATSRRSNSRRHS